eukprot:scaffold27930_cov46-Prasinocladus_malaysianus.AAC.1
MAKCHQVRADKEANPGTAGEDCFSWSGRLQGNANVHASLLNFGYHGLDIRIFLSVDNHGLARDSLQMERQLMCGTMDFRCCNSESQIAGPTLIHWRGFETMTWQSRNALVCFRKLLTTGCPSVRLGTK